MAGNGNRVRAQAICEVCGKLFPKMRKTAKFCSYPCSHKGKSRAKPQEITNGNKKCTECGVTKSISEFTNEKSRSNGYKCSCRACASTRHKAWRAKNLDRQRVKDRVSHYIRKYSLSEIEALELVKDRSGICAICGDNSRLVVDHCHATGKVRGKICSACNSTIGYARNDISILENAIEYLKRNGHHGQSG
jgi:hypothetical protein